MPYQLCVGFWVPMTTSSRFFSLELRWCSLPYPRNVVLFIVLFLFFIDLWIFWSLSLSSESVTALSIRRGSIWRRATYTSPGACGTISISREAAIDTLGGLICVRAANTAHHVFIFSDAVAVAISAARKGGDDGGELPL